MNILESIDAGLPWSDEEQMLLDSVQSVCDTLIQPHAAAYDKNSEFPWDNIRAINELGLNAMFIPEQYGGMLLSYRCYLACVRQISKACAATGIIWATNFHAIKPVIQFGSDALKSRVLPRVAEGALAALVITEPSAGSDATGMKTQFREEGDQIVVDGQKIFISNGDVADFYVVFGKWAGVDSARDAISAVVIEKGTPGLTVTGTEHKMGTRASGTASLSFEGVRIPKENLLAPAGQGLSVLLTSLNKSRPSVAAHALGIARAAFEDAIAYINDRRQSNRRILEFQGVQFMVADLAAELVLCERWLWHVAELVDSGKDDMGIEASVLKLKATDLAMRITTDAVQLHGGYGYCQDFRAERLMRDAKITQIWEGTNQIHRQLIGRSFLKKEVK
ncbi:acyl-CoA dehydrogenase family protein [Advenella mimigardefordensis]|uniref:3-sulfinopropanoyl-CoA desulfinase n=1 Tax=Advenella mimigardefordensis (strain DSM 17166 / LMG 22922 / DPN7) TaxID=1247726 RepID=W0PBM6_ADVMD|nr:acyl-CoA dehydrogenase family protein [Advenella mimigardefordensis]AHG64146.1 acyl-CoA dehydrogenase [Advenella mimigardefordensis DPN7]